jgi:ABC-type transport system substrate-binding protein
MMKKEGHRKKTVRFRAWAIGLSIFLTTLIATAVPAFAKVYLTVGILSEPKNFNPFSASDAWTKKVIRLFYQPLYIADPKTQTLIPWLTEDQPLYDPQRKTVTFHLREMQWDDGREFSADDVVFTVEVFRKFRIPRYYAYWKFVKTIEALDRRTVQITLEGPMPILARRSLRSWVVQKRKWEPIVQKADKRLKEVLNSERAKGRVGDEALEAALKQALRIIQTHKVINPTGLGPFKFKERKTGTYILLSKNDLFFGQGKTIADQELGSHVDRVIFKIYDTVSAAALALGNGDIDFLWKSISHALVKDLAQAPNIRVLSTLDNGYRYLGFNLRKPPMSDAAFRRAIAFLIDKDFILQRIVHGYGQRLDSVIPPGNAFYFNPHTPPYGRGMDRDRRTREAYAILKALGYRWKIPPLDASGRAQRGRGLTMPDGKTVPHLTILTAAADYDTEMAAAGRVIQKWLQDFGVSISWKSMAFGGLMHKIRNEREFDMFIMGWRNLSLDPDYLRRFFHSSNKRPNKWNDTGYNSGQFDMMADRQAKTIDLEARRGIVLDLQTQLMIDLPYIPLFVPHRLEGVRTDRFEGWTTRGGEVGNTWSFSLLRPTEWWDKRHPLHK